MKIDFNVYSKNTGSQMLSVKVIVVYHVSFQFLVLISVSMVIYRSLKAMVNYNRTFDSIW